MPIFCNYWRRWIKKTIYGVCLPSVVVEISCLAVLIKQRKKNSIINYECRRCYAAEK